MTVAKTERNKAIRFDRNRKKMKYKLIAEKYNISIPRVREICFPEETKQRRKEKYTGHSWKF
jgi:hypothetical protein